MTKEITLADLVQRQHRFNVKMGKQFPYFESKRQDWTIDAANAALADLKDRGGIGDMLSDFDDEIRADILESVSLSIYAAYEESQKEKISDE